MADFRRWILALTVLALCVAGANAQINTGTGGGTPFTCNAINGAVTPTVRAEGITELIGDIVIQCQGGTILAPGAQIPQANITVFLNTQVTSRLLGTGSVASASEAVLFIDEPNSGVPGYGPTVPITVCSTPASGCIEFVGNSTLGGVGVPVGSNAAGNQAPGANTFQGVVNPDGKSVTFFGVPIMPPASNGLIRQFRITNIRANASAIPAGANTPGNVQALISISGSSFVPLTNSQLVAGYVVAGLTASTQNFGNTGGLSGSGTTFNQCSSTGNSGNGAPAGILRYHSNFGTAFKTRVLAGTAGATMTGQNGSAAIQNIPGSANNSVSESGFIFNGVPQSNIVGTPATPTGLNGNGAVAGLADFGTRFKAVFNNIPAGVSIFVSTTNVLTITQNNGTVPAQPAANSTTASYAQLIVSETSPENGASAPFLTATGSNGGVNYVPVQVNGNTGTAVWEVINSNTSTNQNFDFGVFLAYSSNVAAGTPTAPSTITVSMSYAPISSTFGASATAPIPRFIDLGTGDNKAIANIAICTTNLLFPYVTTVTGFETGLAISNTTMDPFGTGPQSGACTLYWYGNNAGGNTNTPIANSSSATCPGASATIAAGTTWTCIASDSHMVGQGFTGYMIATCNFQLAHGYAAITDVGTRGILTAYLALVLTGRGTPETLGN